SSQGAALVGAEMRRFPNLREVPKLRGAQKGDAAPSEQPPVQFARPGDALLAYRLVVAGDTVPLARTVFRRAPSPVAATGTAGPGAALPVSITYSFVPDSYTVRVRADAQTATGPAYLLVDLPQTFAVSERDTLDHYAHLAYTWKASRGSAKSQAFAKLDPGERNLVPGPLDWAVAKSKYFLLGVLAPRGTGDNAVAQPFSELSLVGGARTTKVAERAQATLVVPMAAPGTIAGGGTSAQFDVYAGPQEWRRLVAQGRAFEESNPYGGWLQGVVQPFATLAIRAILWMHDALKLSYGWVLVVLGVLIRLVLWPLQQNMMRNQIRMQRVQPEIQLVQTKYKNDPQKLQQEMMKVYAAHGMSPLAPVTGCLPMLIPLPIFFALFFVFQNTIEFRGVPFLWLGDISLKDPFYALPVLVAATQFLISWVGMRGLPPNPQTQMMGYVAPAMFLFFFLNVASGLNLYYLVQNLVMLPQQWLLAKERAKAGIGGAGGGTAAVAKPVVQGTPVRKPRTA
ncbi:MAG TPA: YidC/Oxa1 family insertase periplasmic-domain containing protein, partial [Gemmatirosa sp.]